MSDWKTIHMSEVVDFVTDKIVSASVTLRNYISTDNMCIDRGGILGASTLPQAPKFNHYKQTDTLFSNIRTYFKKVWLADREGGASADVLIFRTKNADVLSPEYLYYILSDQVFTDYTILTSKGAKMPRGDKVAMMRYQFPLPDIKEQNAIASVLRKLDDKIELNRRTNATLEAMARALFKSWFVDFDPVRAKSEGRQPFGMDSANAALFPSRLVPSDLGDIPEGWATGRLSDILELSYGKSLTKEDRQDGAYPVYGSGGVNGFHKESLVHGPGIIVGRKGTVGSLYWEDRDFFPIDTVFYVVPSIYFSLVYLYPQLERLGLSNMNTDAAVPGLNRENAYRLGVIKPPESVVASYTALASGIREKVRSNNSEIESLVSLRDYLLPKLISGDVRIHGAEKSVEAA